MEKRTFWKRVIIIIITGANLLILYYNYRYVKRPSAPQTPVIQTPATNGQQEPTPETKPKMPAVVQNDGQQGQSGSSAIAIVRFESNLKLSPQSQEDLLKIFNTMSERPSMKIEVGGHTDNVGDPLVNLKLSVKRATAIRDYLVKLGISTDRIIVQGYGSTRAIADNNTEEGRAQNRRVEINIISV
jgi:outer membrane protein OmpA-like peptidoglycan-associated protein